MLRTVLGLRTAIVLMGALTFLVVLSSGHAQKAIDSTSKVKVMVKTEPPTDDGKQTVLVTLGIDKGWHVYANPVNGPDEFFEDGATKLTFFHGTEKVEAAVEYPKGKRINFKGDVFSCYDDSVTIKAVVQRPKSGELTLKVKVQACDDEKCLNPGTTQVKVP